MKLQENINRIKLLMGLNQKKLKDFIGLKL